VSSTAILTAGRFFGNPSRHIDTDSFVFAELDATVPDREVPRHTHEVPHFVLVLRGIYSTEARNQNGLCPPGTLIFNPGGTTHRDRFRTDHGRFLSITPKTGVWKTLERASPVPVIVSNPLEELVSIPHVANELARINPDAGYEALGLELIGHLTEPFEIECAIPSWLVRAKEMLDDCADAAASPPIAAVAKAAGVHPISLARSFRKYFGCSPGEYQRRARLARLRNCLVQNEAKLADAALGCGFSDQSQMTRAFSRTFGVSPGRFRRLAVQE
jgi:AraC family transcriptional regulator